MANMTSGQPILTAGQMSSLNIESFPPIIHPKPPNLTLKALGIPGLPSESIVVPRENTCKEPGFANILKAPNPALTPKITVDPIPLKKVEYHNGIPRMS